MAALYTVAVTVKFSSEAQFTYKRIGQSAVLSILPSRETQAEFQQDKISLNRFGSPVEKESYSSLRISQDYGILTQIKLKSNLSAKNLPITLISNDNPKTKMYVEWLDQIKRY